METRPVFDALFSPAWSRLSQPVHEQFRFTAKTSREGGPAGEPSREVLVPLAGRVEPREGGTAACRAASFGLTLEGQAGGVSKGLGR